MDTEKCVEFIDQRKYMQGIRKMGDHGKVQSTGTRKLYEVCDERVEERSKGAAADATCRQDCAITLDQREASACIGSMEGGAVGE